MSRENAHSALTPAVILVRPREDGNVGSAARAMANMGLSELVLVEPATPLGVLGHAFAKGADHVVAGLRRVPSLEEAATGYHRVVGTVSARARSGGRQVLTPRELPPLLAADPPGSRAALVFGPEVSGLTNEELALLDPLVNVPCDPVQPTLNLAQSVLVLAYELHLARIRRGEAEPADFPEGVPEPATQEQVKALFDHVLDLLHRVRFARDDTFNQVRRELRQLLARAAVSEREVTLLRGVVRKIEWQLDRLEELRRAAEGGASSG